MARSMAEPEVPISGRRFGLSLLAAIGSAAAVGVLAWNALTKTMSGLLGPALPQIVTFAVYATLVAVLCYAFRPPGRPPIALRFTGVRDLAFAIFATVVTMAAGALAYAGLGRFLGGFVPLLAHLTAVATDAQRLQGQGAPAWAIAILRGCVLVPIFEELLFRGLLLSWLNRHMRFLPALLLQAALFAAMHVVPVALPYAFLFGMAAGYVRRATGSTFNTVLMHGMNNVVLLSLGLHWFGR
ncbi:MAG: CPBP family intramembrane glutamic endopeptidase [Acidobacteriaceae bacterium]